jgi:predicted permease
MKGWRDDIVHALRSLGRSPLFTAFAGGALALGIGSATALYSAVDRIVLNPLDFPEADRIVSVWRRQGDLLASAERASERAVEALEGVFDRMATVRRTSVMLSTDRGAVPLAAVHVDDRLPSLAGVERPVLGRLFDREDLRGDGAAVVALGERLWRGRFGADPGVIGRTLRIDGEPREVIGVLPAGLTPPSAAVLETDLWLPLADSDETGGLELFARLAPGMSLEGARERVGAVGAEDGEAAEWELYLVPAGSLETQGLQDPLRVVAVAVALLLLIACANVASLMLARADRRARETAVRSALGAGRARLVREALLEALAVALLGCVGGLGVARLALEGIARYRPDGLQLLDGLSLQLPVLGAALLTSLATVLLFGVLPALRRARRDPSGALGGRSGVAGRDSSRLRRGLLVAEVALSFALLVVAIQLVESLAELGGRETGFASDQVVDLRLTVPGWRFPDADSKEAVLGDLAARIAALPGVRGVARGNGVPPQTGIFFGTPAVGGAPADPDATGEIFFGNSVTPGYFETLGQEVVEGRSFTEEEWRDGADVMVMGRSAAERFFPDGQVVGGRFRLDDQPWRTVIGVVDDVLALGTAHPPTHGQIYVPAARGASHTLVVRTETPEAVAGALRSLVADVAPEIAVNSVGPVSDDYRAALAQERLLAFLAAAFALTAALLAAVGLYGVVAWITARRTREFGIRISVGAGRAAVFTLVVRWALGAVGLGLAVGVGVGWLGLRATGHGVAGLDSPRPLAFVLAAALLGCVTLVAASAPARRAARIDPVEALRAE